MMKKWTALIMAASLTAAMASGCTNSENSAASSGSDQSTAAQTQTGAQDSSESASPETDAQAEGELEDTANIVMAFYSPRTISSDELDRVEEAINAITVPEINTSVTLLSLEQGNWDQQINLMFSSNEQLDLLPTFFYGSTSITTLKISESAKYAG